MYKKYIVLLYLLSSAFTLYSQKVEGTIKDNFGTIIPRASVVLKTSKNSSTISEFFIADDKGSFTYEVRKKVDGNLYLEISALNFEKTMDSIVNPVANQQYLFNFVLTPKVTKLEEVIISELKKFDSKEDTVVFNPEAYKDGTERKVEDLLKKLPGMQVGEDGQIKYRGKTVQTVQLDGDDLFGYNYSIGTKNISIDMVDQIEAIEHYSKNPLLKGIENSDNVAINLKLKKGKVDYSGTGNIGYGYGDKPYYDVSTNVLGIAKSFKSFGTLSFNNIGINDTPFDYFSKSITLEDIENENLNTKKIVDDAPLSSVLSNSRVRVNEEWFGSYNFIYRFSRTLSLKSNIYYVKDEFFKQELFQNIFFVGAEEISYSDQTDITKSPENKRLDLKLTHNISQKSLLEMETSISKEAISSRNNLTRNLETNSTAQLSTNDFFWNNKLQFTSKMSSKSALQFVSQYSRNNAPQKFNTFGNFLSEENVNNSYFQFSEFRKEAFQNYLALLGKRKRVKYVLTAGVHHYENPFRSYLLENKALISGFQNNFRYKKTSYFSQFSLAYVYKKFTIEPSLGLNYVSQGLKNKLDITSNLKEQVLYPEVELKTTYTFNSVSTLKFSGSYNQKTPQDNFLFANRVITNNRSVSSNIISLDLEQHQKYSVGYRLNDLFKNIDIGFTSRYTNRKNVYLSNININSNFTAISYFQSPANLDDWFFTFSIERYIRIVRTTLKHSFQYSISNFKNIINQSDFRNGQSNSFSGNIFAKTAYRIPINFENKIEYTRSSYEVSNQSANTNYAVKNSFRTIIKPNRNWLLTLTYDYFKPNIKSNQDFSFLDFDIRYQPKNLKWISGRVIGKNLFDNRVFEQVENSDFSTTLYQSNLISRYIMLSLDLSF